jgi:hypothetical protein
VRIAHEVVEGDEARVAVPVREPRAPRERVEEERLPGAGIAEEEHRVFRHERRQDDRLGDVEAVSAKAREEARPVVIPPAWLAGLACHRATMPACMWAMKSGSPTSSKTVCVWSPPPRRLTIREGGRAGDRAFSF